VKAGAVMEGERIMAGQLVSRLDGGHFITLLKAVYLMSVGLQILGFEAGFGRLRRGDGDPDHGQGHEETGLSIYEGIKRMLIKELLRTLRDAMMIGAVFVIPIMRSSCSATLYGLDNSAASLEPVARFVHSGYVDIVAYVRDDGYARRLQARPVMGIMRHQCRPRYPSILRHRGRIPWM
jgi:hypothetical protein